MTYPSTWLWNIYDERNRSITTIQDARSKFRDALNDACRLGFDSAAERWADIDAAEKTYRAALFAHGDALLDNHEALFGLASDLAEQIGSEPTGVDAGTLSALRCLLGIAEPAPAEAGAEPPKSSSSVLPTDGRGQRHEAATDAGTPGAVPTSTGD